jgi:hypothetical protein
MHGSSVTRLGGSPHGLEKVGGCNPAVMQRSAFETDRRQGGSPDADLRSYSQALERSRCGACLATPQGPSCATIANFGSTLSSRAAKIWAMHCCLLHVPRSVNRNESRPRVSTARGEVRWWQPRHKNGTLDVLRPPFVEAAVEGADPEARHPGKAHGRSNRRPDPTCFGEGHAAGREVVRLPPLGRELAPLGALQQGLHQRTQPLHHHLGGRHRRPPRAPVLAPLLQVLRSCQEPAISSGKFGSGSGSKETLTQAARSRQISRCTGADVGQSHQLTNTYAPARRTHTARIHGLVVCRRLGVFH